MNNRLFLLATLLLLLPGCATRSAPPADIYIVDPSLAEKVSSEAAAQSSGPVIKLAPMDAIRSFTGTEILYKRARHEQNSYAFSRWSDAPVRMLQALFQTSLSDSAQFKAVLPAASTSEAEYILESTLYDFSHHIHEGGTSSGNIRVRFYLIDQLAGTVTATREFESTVAATAQNARSAAEALNQAAANVARDLVEWLRAY
ncbi:MAG: hypothetical protein CO186_10055 [Zetaproteobacteria bacterium CG_4_9_14_3_um_filter_49_83]|nr:MAG: hypothetical protein AUJ56_03025 [Zetaproteobacteria bacterium CG1_02_49_23]PIQ34516.1 MAG: hypothetical protein COW62_01570 [Zetaproteobacteria bacterium CG17_big_fil_post_rev_8_21_14_2_50_50_13]PIV30035.1 MAG: hypothetical protein COS35_08875 [Zetaproteobacteria bacterium CG02_land_8_20_14_3_00_50_9]PIY55339.1 MAG: hypothetical protein COZ00_09985 [Zetaproteobacteria bacterium CG_4_10_14_0_8_um_filter_49_80]PJA34496.1 MAG: hypothetical protein CO186_10055 [Zetaproteobacteria bacterium